MGCNRFIIDFPNYSDTDYKIYITYIVSHNGCIEYNNLILGSKAVITLSVTPESRNVSEGKMVEFTCATPDTGVTLAWTITPNVGAITPVDTDLPGGGKQSVLSFTATAQHNNTLITCLAVNGTTNGNQSTALLLVQGKSTVEQSL